MRRRCRSSQRIVTANDLHQLASRSSSKCAWRHGQVADVASRPAEHGDRATRRSLAKMIEDGDS